MEKSSNCGNTNLSSRPYGPTTMPFDRINMTVGVDLLDESYQALPVNSYSSISTYFVKSGDNWMLRAEFDHDQKFSRRYHTIHKNIGMEMSVITGFAKGTFGLICGHPIPPDELTNLIKKAQTENANNKNDEGVITIDIPCRTSNLLPEFRNHATATAFFVPYGEHGGYGLKELCFTVTDAAVVEWTARRADYIIQTSAK